MIGWRYHLISIVAVFLALGLGLLMGTALLNDRLVENLRERTENAQQLLTEREDQLARLTAFATSVLPFVLQERLSGQQIVVVTHEGVDEGAVADARRALDQAGAEVVATLALQPGLEAASLAERRTLSELLAVSESAPREEVAAAVMEALAERLSAGVPVGTEEEDLLALLLSEGFVVALDPGLESTVGIGGQEQVMVFVGGSPDVDPPGVGETFLSLIAGAAEQGTVLAVGERTTSAAGIVGSIRATLDPGGPLVTVDDLDLPAGATALVIGLQQAIETGRGGDYGVGQDAQQLLPSAA